MSPPPHRPSPSSALYPRSRAGWPRATDRAHHASRRVARDQIEDRPPIPRRSSGDRAAEQRGRSALRSLQPTLPCHQQEGDVASAHADADRGARPRSARQGPLGSAPCGSSAISSAAPAMSASAPGRPRDRRSSASAAAAMLPTLQATDSVTPRFRSKASRMPFQIDGSAMGISTRKIDARRPAPNVYAVRGAGAAPAPPRGALARRARPRRRRPGPSARRRSAG